MRLNFYVSFDNVYDSIDPLLAGDTTRMKRATGPDYSMPVWSFDHLNNMGLYPGRNLNQSLNQIGSFPMDFVNSLFIQDESKPEVNFILRLLSSNLNFNQMSMRATLSTCPVGTRFFLIKPTDMTAVFDYYKNLYNIGDDEPVTSSRKARLFGGVAYTESDIIESINGAYARGEHFFSANGTSSSGYFTSGAYQTNQLDQQSDLTCQLLVKE